MSYTDPLQGVKKRLLSLWKLSPSYVTWRTALYPNVAGWSSRSHSAGIPSAWQKRQPVNLIYLTSTYEDMPEFEINQFVQLWFNCNHTDMPFSSFSVCVILCLWLILALTEITIFLCSFVQNKKNPKPPLREERNNESIFTNSQKKKILKTHPSCG